MAQTYFADAWYFIALLEPRDSHHRNARRLAAALGRKPVVTTEAVLTEVLTYFSDEGARARALAAEAARAAFARFEVVSGDRALFLRALALYEGRPDKEYSLVDCLSMQIARERGITYVLTNDHHFRQEGFSVLNDAP
ncbi:MAG TPA: PIN domain-containing protein [Thermoanaerobaculia bacterium]|jgi:predicted nucleic acid-binding protein